MCVFVQENQSVGLEGSVRPTCAGQHSVLENISGQSVSQSSSDVGEVEWNVFSHFSQHLVLSFLV